MPLERKNRRVFGPGRVLIAPGGYLQDFPETGAMGEKQPTAMTNANPTTTADALRGGVTV